MTMGKCEICGDSERDLAYGLVGLFSVLALILWYFFAWRPLLRPLELAIRGCVCKRPEPREPGDSDDGKTALKRDPLWRRMRRSFKKHFSRSAFRIMVTFFQV